MLPSSSDAAASNAAAFESIKLLVAPAPHTEIATKRQIVDAVMAMKLFFILRLFIIIMSVGKILGFPQNLNLTSNRG